MNKVLWWMRNILKNKNWIIIYFAMIMSCIDRVLVSILKSYSFYKSSLYWQLFYKIIDLELSRRWTSLSGWGHYSTIKGRQTVKMVLSKGIIFKVLQGKTLSPPSPAKFPEYRLSFEYSFENVELDYASPSLIYSYLHVLLHGILIYNWHL